MEHRICSELRTIGLASGSESIPYIIRPHDSAIECTALFGAPSHSPFADVLVEVLFTFPVAYPFSPLHGRCLSQLFHPNIAADGLFNAGQDFWAPNRTMKSALETFWCDLVSPRIDTPARAEAAELLRNDEAQFNERACAKARLLPRVRAVAAAVCARAESKSESESDDAEAMCAWAEHLHAGLGVMADSSTALQVVVCLFFPSQP